jgi:hypothetical protein
MDAQVNAAIRKNRKYERQGAIGAHTWQNRTHAVAPKTAAVPFGTVTNYDVHRVSNRDYPE